MSGLLQGHREDMWGDLATTRVATPMVRVRRIIGVATLVVAIFLHLATTLVTMCKIARRAILHIVTIH